MTVIIRIVHFLANELALDFSVTERPCRRPRRSIQRLRPTGPPSRRRPASCSRRRLRSPKRSARTGRAQVGRQHGVCAGHGKRWRPGTGTDLWKVVVVQRQQPAKVREEWAMADHGEWLTTPNHTQPPPTRPAAPHTPECIVGRQSPSRRRPAVAVCQPGRRARATNGGRHGYDRLRYDDPGSPSAGDRRPRPSTSSRTSRTRRGAGPRPPAARQLSTPAAATGCR